MILAAGCANTPDPMLGFESGSEVWLPLLQTVEGSPLNVEWNEDWLALCPKRGWAFGFTEVDVDGEVTPPVAKLPPGRFVVVDSEGQAQFRIHVSGQGRDWWNCNCPNVFRPCRRRSHEDSQGEER